MPLWRGLACSRELSLLKTPKNSTLKRGFHLHPIENVPHLRIRGHFAPPENGLSMTLLALLRHCPLKLHQPRGLETQHRNPTLHWVGQGIAALLAHAPIG